MIPHGVILLGIVTIARSIPREANNVCYLTRSYHEISRYIASIVMTFTLACTRVSTSSRGVVKLENQSLEVFSTVQTFQQQNDSFKTNSRPISELFVAYFVLHVFSEFSNKKQKSSWKRAPNVRAQNWSLVWP